MKKVAVNIVDSYDLHQVHTDVVNYLYGSHELYDKDVAQGAIQIDYYVCNDSTTTNSYPLDFAIGSTVYNTQLRGYNELASTLQTGKNAELCLKTNKLVRNLYRSWVNGNALQKNAAKDVYSIVITYSPLLGRHRSRFLYDKDFLMELDILYAIVYEPRLLKMDYDCFVSSYYGFNKLVNFWRFLPYVEDSTFRIWDWFNTSDDPAKFILPMWLNMQSIKVRDITIDS